MLRVRAAHALPNIVRRPENFSNFSAYVPEGSGSFSKPMR